MCKRRRCYYLIKGSALEVKHLINPCFQPGPFFLAPFNGTLQPYNCPSQHYFNWYQIKDASTLTKIHWCFMCVVLGGQFIENMLYPSEGIFADLSRFLLFQSIFIIHIDDHIQDFVHIHLFISLCFYIVSMA